MNKFSWPFSQHAIALKPDNLIGLLSSSAIFEGHKNVGNKINLLLSQKNILTKNIRAGKMDAWRDYQQILAEVGLIFSTRLDKKIRLTEVGRLMLSNEIGFSELMSIQALRYQYPNGLKFSFIKDHINSGVLIKPGLLILRLLIELLKNNKKPFISIDQMQVHLLNIKNNSDWPKAYALLLNDPNPDNRINRHARRNMQDWVKFLCATDLFVLYNDRNLNGITFSQYSLSQIDILNKICSHGEMDNDFWIPKSFEKEEVIKWFAHFGHIPIEYQELLSDDLTEEYIVRNYFEKKYEEEDEHHSSITQKINLSELKGGHINSIDISNNELINEIVNTGALKRREKTKLHNEIVGKLAKYYSEKGFKVFEDKQSIDLAVMFHNKDISIFEVKTATKRNLLNRSRLAIGQVMEYAYRYNEQQGIYPQKNIVFNVSMNNQNWLKEYVNEHLKIGIVSFAGENKEIYLPKNCTSQIQKIG